ncbi:hypothetical protein [uncultured Aliiroseovarius sp.]|uniref:hypothetical protein n=1 Tax=uncultured Aliiroseovarius sp. TaxID=1658783 RepID=UPI0026184DF4|nr:hypothetical protein [uncultured Aliiroseovarius sp.]
MTRCFTASPLKMLLSAALALALATSPATAQDTRQLRKDDSDIAPFLAAILGIATIGVLLSDKKDDARKPVATHRHGGHRPHVHRPHGHHPHGHPSKRPHKPVAKTPHKVDRYNALPASCLKRFDTQFGRSKYMGRSCLQKRIDRRVKLPRACLDTIVVRDRYGKYVPRDVYEPVCLQNKGFRIVRSR